MLSFQIQNLEKGGVPPKYWVNTYASFFFLFSFSDIGQLSRANGNLKGKGEDRNGEKNEGNLYNIS